MKYFKFFVLPIFLVAMFAGTNILFAENTTKETKEKIAISIVGKSPLGIDSEIAQRFSKCPYFILLPISNNKIDKSNIVIIKNEAKTGTDVAKMLKSYNVKCVITQKVGANAHKELQKANITAYEAKGSVRKAVENFNQKKLNKITPKIKKK